MRIRSASVVPALLALCLAGCATFPELDRIAAGAAGMDDTAPALVPLEPLLAAAPATRATPEEADALTARADALRARAAALQREGGIDTDTRTRMQDGVDVPD